MFGISATEFAVCYQLIDEGEATVEELTEAVDRNQSVVPRHYSLSFWMGDFDSVDHISRSQLVVGYWILYRATD